MIRVKRRVLYFTLRLRVVSVSDDGGHYKAVSECSQRVDTAPVRHRRHAAGVRVPHQLSWRRAGDAGGHGYSDA